MNHGETEIKILFLEKRLYDDKDQESEKSTQVREKKGLKMAGTFDDLEPNKVFMWQGRKYNTNSVKNLIPLQDRTPEERREISRMGGIASGIARAYKREIRETAERTFDAYLLSEGYLNQDIKDFREWQKAKRRKEYKQKKEGIK